MTPAPDDRVTYLGRTTFRNQRTLFGIRQADRRQSVLVLGKTGVGKSHTLRLVMEQDMRAGAGVALFDPHSDLAAATRALVPPEREDDVIYVDPADAASIWRFNPFRDVPRDTQPLAAAGIVSVFNKLWIEDWGPRLEHLLRNVAFTLLETPAASFADIPELLSDRTARRDLASGLTNSAVRAYWVDEFEKFSPAFRATVTQPLLNKVGALITDPVLRRFFTEDGQLLNLRQVIDDGKILIVNLDKGRLGEHGAMLIGSLLLSHLALAGLGRSAATVRRDYSVVLDEFQLFTTRALANMMSELRKFGVSMWLSTQYLAALEPAIRDAVLGNAGTILAFRLGATDAAHMARELGDPITPADFTSLPNHQMYVRLLINGEPSKPFSAAVLPNIET